MDIINRLEAAGIEVKETGKASEFILQCPECNRWKLYVNPEKKNWVCFYCDDGGGLRTLCKKLGLEHEEDASSELARLRARARGIIKPAPVKINKFGGALPREYQKLGVGEPSIVGRLVRDYLLKRGVTDAMMERWNLGYCSAGPLTGHLIMPLTDLQGNIVSFQARRLIGQGPKSYNPPGDAGLMFNIHLAKASPGLVLVEGPFDAMAVHTKMEDERQPVSAVALMGVGISEESAAIIGRLMKPTIAWVMLDPDMEESRGHKIGSFLARNGISEIKIAKSPLDPDELAYDILVEVLESAVPLRRQANG